MLVALLLAVLVPTTITDDLDTLKKELERAIRVGDTQAAAALIEEIAGLETPEAMRVLLLVTLNCSEDEAIFNALRDSLEKVTGPEGLRFLCDVLGREKSAGRKLSGWEIRVTIAEVFGRRDDGKTMHALIGALSDPALPVLRQVLASLEQREARQAVPALIDLLEKVSKSPGVAWEDTLECLRAITGQDLTEPADWRNYWAAHGGKGAPRREEEDGEDEESTRKRIPPAEFFGVKIISKRVVFVIDVSGSMMLWDSPTDGETPRGAGGRGFSEGRQRISRAKKELIGAIRDLRPKVKFNIVTFASGVQRFRKGELIPATDQNKAAAIRFVERLSAGGTTATDDALREAFRCEEANTIILLSDGMPVKPQGRAPTPEELLAMVRQLNRFRKAKVHTFGFDGEGKRPPSQKDQPPIPPGALDRFREMMIQMAEENDGKWTPIR